MRLQERPRNKVITPERQQARSLADDVRRMFFDRIRHRFRVAEIKKAVSIVDHCQLVERVDVCAVRPHPRNHG